MNPTKFQKPHFAYSGLEVSNQDVSEQAMNKLIELQKPVSKSYVDISAVRPYWNAAAEKVGNPHVVKETAVVEARVWQPQLKIDTRQLENGKDQNSGWVIFLFLFTAEWTTSACGKSSSRQALLMAVTAFSRTAQIRKDASRDLLCLGLED